MKNEPVPPPPTPPVPTDEQAVQAGQQVGQIRPRSGVLGDVVALVIAAALVAVASLVGFALVSSGVPLFLEAPPLFARVMPHWGIGTPFAIVLGVLGLLFATRIAHSLRWKVLAPLATGTAAAWTCSLALIDGWQRGWADRLTTPVEYLHDLPMIGGVGQFLRDFSSHIIDFQPGSWTTHVSSHPPGATLIFLVLDRIGLGGGGWAGAAVIAVGSSAGTAVCLSVRELGAPRAARRMLPFAVFFPGAVWVGVSADGLFAGFAAWGIALAVIGCRRGGRFGVAVTAMGGLLLGYTLYLSYGLILIGVVMLTAVAFSAHRRVWLAAIAAAAAVAVTFTLSGFNWLQGEHLVTIRYYQGVASGRPYGYYVWANLAALTLSAGPAVAIGLRRAVPILGRARRHAVDRETLVPAALSLAAFTAVLIADLSGLSKAETERIWLPFGVWLLASLALLPKRIVPIALALQILTALTINHLLLTYW